MALAMGAQAVKLGDWTDVPKMKAEVQHFEWCPDFDERHVLKDGKTQAIPWPEYGFNCKVFHDVLGPNHSPYSQEHPGWQ